MESARKKDDRKINDNKVINLLLPREPCTKKFENGAENMYILALMCEWLSSSRLLLSGFVQPNIDNWLCTVQIRTLTHSEQKTAHFFELAVFIPYMGKDELTNLI